MNKHKINQTVQRISVLGLVIFFLASCCYFYDFFMQVFPSMITHKLMVVFNVDATILGVLASTYFYLCAFIQLPAGLVVDRYGAHKILTGVIFLSAAGVLIFISSTHILFAALGRILMGLGGGFAFVSALFLIANWFPIRLYALFVGLLQMVASLGAVVALAPMGVLIEQVGWRLSVLYIAIFGFVLAFLILILVRDHPKKAQLKIPKEHKVNLINCARIVFRKSQNWFLFIFTFSVWAPVSTFAVLWGVPFLMRMDSLDRIAAASAVTFIWVGLALGSPMVGWLSDRLGYRKPLLLIPKIMGFIALLLVIFVKMPWIILSFLLFFVGFSASGQALSFAVSRENNHTQLASTAAGFNNMATFTSGALLQPLVGKILDICHVEDMSMLPTIYSVHDYQVALGCVLPTIDVIGIIVLLFFIKETYCRTNL